MNRHLFWLVFFLGIKAQAHTFMPLSDFINEYETYAKKNDLSIRLAIIQTEYYDELDLESIDYTNSQDPILLELRKNSLQKKTMPPIISRNFKFGIFTHDTNIKIGKIVLHEGVEPTHGAFFSISCVKIDRKYEEKEEEAETKALQDSMQLFETILLFPCPPI